MPFTYEGYNISFNAQFFNSIPHLQLTNEGLIPLSNTTFDYDRLSYVNSLLVTFTFPLLLLLLVFAIYIVYILVIRTVTEDRYLINANYHQQQQQQQSNLNNQSHYKLKATYHKAAANSAYHNNNKSLSSLKRIHAQRKCHGLYLVFGVAAILGATYGTILLNQGLNRSDTVLTEFIRVATNSKQAIGNFSQRILPKPSSLHMDTEEYYEYPEALHSVPPAPKSAFQRWFPNTYNYIETYAGYTNSSSDNVRHFQSRFRHANYAATSLNVTALLMCGLYWILFVALGMKRLDVKHFVLLNIIILVLLTVIFNLNFTGNIALSDFCLTAKPVIVDITVYKIPSNNFTTKLVNYYLYCDLNRFKLDEHKNTVLGFLDRFSDKFNTMLSNTSSRVLSGIVSNVKSGIEHTYDTLHCVELNRLINEGLSEFCTSPVDGMAITSVSYFFSLFLCVIVLFMVTFML